MASTNGRFSQLRWLQTIASIAAVIGACLLMVLGLMGYGSSSDVWMIAAGFFILFGVILAMTFSPLIIKMESTLARTLSELRDLNETTEKQVVHLNEVAENTRISDAAKSLSRREEELDALRTAIRNDIREERWEAALSLIEEMVQRYGYKEEADRVREELDDARNSQIQLKLSEAIEMIQSHFDSFEWDRAKSEIDRLLHALPDDTRVLSLLDRMKALQDEHKHDLLKSWDEAVRRADTDHAIDILKELDQYLSPAEAQTLQATARTVFKEKLLQLGIQFRFAVTERRWQDALDSGMEIIHEYPNARMANEVREALDTLRQRARQVEEEALNN